VAIWSRVQALIAGGAVARGAADAVTPVLEPVRQTAWSKNQQRVLDPGTAARLVAQAIVALEEAETESGRSGVNANRLRALVQLSQTAPGQADLDRMLNRHTISRSQFNHAMAKHQIEPQYWDALYDLTNDRLSVADVAAAVQQGHMPNEGILPDVSAAVQPAQGSVTPQAPDHQPPSHVPLTQIDIDPIAEAAADGYDLSRLQVRANLSGLPPGAETLLTMWNRQLIDEASVDAGIREGHIKTKWAGAFKRMRWSVLSAQEYASAHLRQWVTQEEMYEGGALTGHTKDQMDLLFLNRGRPASPTQMWRAWARQVDGPRGVPVEFEDHAKAIAISDIRPEYAEMLWNIRFNYPSLFQLNRLVSSGAISAAVAADWAHKSLYAPEVVTALEAFWTGGSTGTADTHVSKAQIQLWATLHRSYLSGESSEQEVTAALPRAGVAAGSVPDVLATWDEERAIIRKQLSPAQVKKAYAEAVLNPDTGAAWTKDEATAALVARGYSTADATTFLEL